MATNPLTIKQQCDVSWLNIMYYVTRSHLVTMIAFNLQVHHYNGSN